MKTIISIFIISSLFFVALSQTAAGTSAPANCASAATSSGFTASQCTACNSGYLLNQTQSACTSATPCMNGCSICNNGTYCYAAGCNSGTTSRWQYNTGNGHCVDCTGVLAAPTAQNVISNCATCTVAANATGNAVVCVTCAAGYVLSSQVCYLCSNTSGTTVVGVANCLSCTTTKPAAITITGTSPPAGVTVATGLVTCTACNTGYFLVPTTTQSNCQNNAGTATIYVVVASPACLSVTTANTADLGTVTGNYLPVTVFPAGSTIAGCANAGTLTWSNTAVLTVTCTQPVALYFCVPVASTACSLTTPTAPPAAIPPTGCTSAIITSATGIATSTYTAGTAVQCWGCASGYTAVGTAGAYTCVANNATICIAGTMLTTTTCTQAAVGYNVAATGGAPSLCSNITTSCSGGCASGSFLSPAGACLTGTAITSCTYANSTTFCVQCAGYSTTTPMCAACSAGCSICATTTNCSNCSSGFSSSGSGTCVSNANTTAKSSNMLYISLSFISLIFYYIL